MTTQRSRIVVFTDLDGTLLDAETYSFDGAQPVLEELRDREIPLVACTSKTAAETRHFLGRLEVEAPYIVESGSGVYLPEGLQRLGASYAEVLRGMADLREHTGGAVRGFHDMTDDEVARETGLPMELAALARKREFDEPFRLLRDREGWASELDAVAARRDLRVTRGGRYWHLHGNTDKGRAVEAVLSHYRRQGDRISTIGAGDSEMDLPLLEAVDIPVLVAKPGGGYDPVLLERIQPPVLSGVPGPAGWSRGVGEALSRLIS